MQNGYIFQASVVRILVFVAGLSLLACQTSISSRNCAQVLPVQPADLDYSESYPFSHTDPKFMTPDIKALDILLRESEILFESTDVSKDIIILSFDKTSDFAVLYYAVKGYSGLELEFVFDKEQCPVSSKLYYLD